MALPTAVSAAYFQDITVNTPLNCAFPLYEETEIEVVYGSQALRAQLNLDYTVQLNAGLEYVNFTVTPLQPLIDKINDLIITPPTEAEETNFVVVRRILPFTTSTTPQVVRDTTFLSREIDRVHMKVIQLKERVDRSVSLPATVVGVDEVEYTVSTPVEGFVPVWRGTRLVAEIPATNILDAEEYALAAMAARDDAEDARDTAINARDSILTDPGFILVSEDLEGGNTIGIVADDIASVRQVGANITSVNTVAGHMSVLLNINSNMADINEVSDNMSSIQEVTANMSDITSAYANAVNAYNSSVSAEQFKNQAYFWANNPEDIPVEGGEYSAFHWAQKAKEFAGGAASAITTDESGWNGLSGENVQEVFDKLDPLFISESSFVTNTVIDDFEGSTGGFAANTGNTTLTNGTVASHGTGSLRVQNATNGTVRVNKLYSGGQSLPAGKYAIDVRPTAAATLKIMWGTTEIVPVTTLTVNEWTTIYFDLPGGVANYLYLDSVMSSSTDIYYDYIRSVDEVSTPQLKLQSVVDGDYTGYDVLTSGDVHAKMLEGKPFKIQGAVAGFTNAPLSYGTSIVGLIQPKTISANLTVYEYTPLGFSDMGLNQWIRRDNSVDNWTVWLPQNDLPSDRFQNQSITIGENNVITAPFDGLYSIDVVLPASSQNTVRVSSNGRGFWLPTQTGATNALRTFTAEVSVNKGEQFVVAVPAGSTISASKFSKSNRTV